MGEEQSSGDLQSTTPKPFVFVLMPFDESFNDTYKFGIKGAAEEVGAYAERVDEQIFTEGILDRIFSEINKADVIVADMTGRNPNVFYEVGYAHALGKIVLFLTREANDIPFDLKHQQHTVYGGSIDTLKRELVRKLRWALDNPKVRSEDVVLTLQLTRFVSHASENPPYLLVVKMRNDGRETIERFRLQIDAPYYGTAVHTLDEQFVETASIVRSKNQRYHREVLRDPESGQDSVIMTYWSEHPLLPGEELSLTDIFSYDIEFHGFTRDQIAEWFKSQAGSENGEVTWALCCDRRPPTKGKISLRKLFETSPWLKPI
jgi:hypothetical protein